MKRSRNGWLYAGIGLLALTIAFLVTNTPHNTEQGRFGSEAQNDVIAVSYWTHADPNRTALEEELISEFEARYPYISVERNTFDSREIANTVLTAFAAGREPDLFNIQIENAARYIDDDSVAPADLQAFGFTSLGDMQASYTAGVLDPVIRDGVLYGVPLELTNWAIYINRRMFREAGLDPDQNIPRTWEDMVEISRRLVVRDGERLLRRGFDFRYTDYLIAVIPMVEQLGGQLISDDGSDAIVGADAWIRVLEYFRAWGPSGYYLGSPHYESARALFNFDRGEIAMAHTGLYQQSRMRADNPEFWESNDWMVVPFPRFSDAKDDVASSIYGHYMMVSNSADAGQQNAAWKLAAFLLSHADRYLEEVHIVQPTRALIESELYQNMPFSDVFLEEMARGHIVYHGPYSVELQNLVRDAVEAVMFGGSTPQRAYLTLRARAREVLYRQD